MFIKRVIYGGSDWHDSYQTITQIKWNNQFEIPVSKVTDCIVNNIMQDLPDLDPIDFYNAVLRNKTYRFPVLISENEKIIFPEEDEDIWESYGEIQGYSLNLYYYGGQVSEQIDYEISDIPQKQICYLVEEHFYAYAKGVPLIERFYHRPFEKLKEAESYLKTLEKHDERSKISIQVYNLQEISSTEWFRTNMEVIKLSLEDVEKNYSVFTANHLENLKKSSTDLDARCLGVVPDSNVFT